MLPLPPTQRRTLDAVQGWLLLGNAREARAEFDQLPTAAQDHPDTLPTRYELLTQETAWEEAYRVACALVESTPDELTGYVWRAYAARRMPGGGLDRAFEALKPGLDRFPREPLIHFNLACYCCQLGRLDEARRWLAQALAHGGDAIQELIKTDPDLEPLRAEPSAPGPSEKD
jgi:predicted Zn-dependent protease